MSSSTLMHTYHIQDTNLILDGGKKEYLFFVRDWSADRKPQEKLMEAGPDLLSVNELLAVLLVTGTRREEILALSARILKEYGERSVAHQKDPKAMAKELDIPLVKACQIVACFELGRRFFETRKNGLAVIRTAHQAFEYLKDMRDLKKEELRGIYLNSRQRIVHDEVISVGSVTANIIHPREVFRPALEFGAVAVIVAHNHPSGDSEPSEEDIRITRQLIEAGKILGVAFLDHLVVVPEKFVSIVSLLGLQQG